MKFFFLGRMERTCVWLGVMALGMIFLALPGFAEVKTGSLVINADEEDGIINKNIYGQFAEHLGGCIYGGLWVEQDSSIPNTRGIRNDVVEALKKIKVPVLRWPGGCFADEYHWMDGIGPYEQRPTMANTNWGMVTENNHFGTHEFMDLCDQLGCDAYICGNVGSGTVHEMQQWVEYMTFNGKSPMADLRRKNGREEPWKVRFWGVGNESWGCGGNMTPEYYSDLYRQYSTYLRNFPGSQLFKIACGSYGDRFDWTEVLMKNVGDRMNGLSLHYYCGSGEKSHSATQFEEEDWFGQLRRALEIEKYLTAHSAIMDQYDPRKHVGLIVDEWGAWHNVEPGTNGGFLYQQNSLRDALVAGLTLNIFHQHCDRVQMANIAQMINVLQAMILTDGPKILTTPTYHVFEMYKDHQDATLLHTSLKSPDYLFGDQKIPMINASASRGSSGEVLITLCNLDPNNDAKVECDVRGMKIQGVSSRVLTAEVMTAHNTFDEPDAIHPVDYNGYEIHEGGLLVTLPAKSVTAVVIK